MKAWALCLKYDDGEMFVCGGATPALYTVLDEKEFYENWSRHAGKRIPSGFGEWVKVEVEITAEDWERWG